jgi:hypothetical protein
MWFQFKVLAFLFVVCSLIAWCAPADYHGLRESAWRALEGSIRDLTLPGSGDGSDDVPDVPDVPRASVVRDSTASIGTTTAARKRISAYTMKRVGYKFGWKCAACHAPLRDDFHVDHIVPLHRRLSLGQPLDNDIEGLQPLCPSCHGAKNHREQSH